MGTPTSNPDALQARILELEARVAELQARGTAHEAEFLESLLGALPAFVLRIGADLRIRYINHTALGFSLEETIGRSMFDFIAPETIPVARAAVEEVLLHGVTRRYHGPGQGDHGQWANYESIVAPVAEPDGSRGVILVAFDVTEQTERERALARSEEQLRIALEATGLGLWTWEVASGKVEWSDRMCEIMGSQTPLVPQDYLEHVHPEDRDALRRTFTQLMKSSEGLWTPHRLVRPGGEVRWVIPCGSVSRDEQGRPQRVVGGLLDVTHIRSLEARLQRAEKLESLGTLTAGVAHNFNNLLAVIRPTLDLLDDYVLPGGRPLLQEAIQATDRATSIIRQLMTLAGTRRVPSSGRADLGALASSAVQMGQRRFGGSLELRLERADGALPIVGEGPEVEQVLVNLIVNAHDALSSAAAAHPRVTVRVRRLAEPPPHLGLEPRAYACVEVEDNGPGVQPGAEPRLFDPFFTTKAPGQGTGLGLAISWSVVRSLGGTIEARSRPGEGASFLVYLPLRAESSSAAAGSPIEHEAGAPLRVLLVEDNEPVLRVISATLERAGHEVLAATSAAAALAIEAQPPVQVVLLDQSLPDRRGTEIVDALRARWPQVKLALFTGELVTEPERASVDLVLSKPLSNADLLAALRQLGG